MHIDGAGRVPNFFMIVATFICLFGYADDFKRYKKPLLIWGIWCVYTIINILFQGLSEQLFDNYLDMLLKILVRWSYLLVLLTMFSRRAVNTIFSLLLALLSSCILYSLYGEWTLTGGGYNRFYSDVINANEMAYVGVILIFIILYYIIVY